MLLNEKATYRYAFCRKNVSRGGLGGGIPSGFCFIFLQRVFSKSLQ